MSTLDDHSKGNYGIYDVLKVLEFIQRYIHKFCGDPNKVTLVGFGSGAAIAGILTLSPKAMYQGRCLIFSFSYMLILIGCIGAYMATSAIQALSTL